MHDRYIPDPLVQSRHDVRVAASMLQVWPVVRRLDMGASRIVRSLYRLRGLGDLRSLADAQRAGFSILDEEAPVFLALGAIGRPWRLGEGLHQSLDREAWLDFDATGYAKISWTFRLESPTDEAAHLSTETRVICTDTDSRRRFEAYWALVRPFSGLIRRELLRWIKREAEEVG